MNDFCFTLFEHVPLRGILVYVHKVEKKLIVRGKCRMWRHMTVEQERRQYELLRIKVSGTGTLMCPNRLLEYAVGHYANDTALIFEDQHITYQELYDWVCRFATVLRKHKVKPQERILLCFDNSPEFYVAYYAIWHVGAVVTPLNTFLHDREFAHIVKDAKPSHIITSVDRAESFRAALPEQKLDLLTEKDLRAVQHEGVADREIIDIPLEQMTALLYTSGTTGLPKGVVLSGKNIMINVLQGVARLPFERERVLGVLPLFHSFAQCVCVWGAIFTGSTVLLSPKIGRSHILSVLKYKPTVFLGVPALYGLLCMLRTAPMSAVKMFVSGGDALPDRIRLAFSILYRRKISSGYGMTETSPLLSIDTEMLYAPTSMVGRPFYGIDVSVRDEKGKELPAGEIGELWVRGDNVMLGYYQLPEETERMLRDGWLDTGDLAYLTAEGEIVITGRLKDLIIHKGLNIYPQEIENVIIAHSNVLRVGVIGKVDESTGEVPVAFVQLRAEQEGVEQELHELCSQHLATYKQPREFLCSADELATTATGKVDKKVLRKQLAG